MTQDPPLRRVRVAASSRLLGMYCWKKPRARMLSIQMERLSRHAWYSVEEAVRG